MKVTMTKTTIDITGNGNDWTRADHRLHDALLRAGADEEVMDQEQDGSCHTRLTLPTSSLDERLNRMIADAAHASIQP